MRIYIHIGYPKTASSWLQMRLFPFIENYTLVERKDIVNKLIRPSSLNYDPEKTRLYFKNKFGSNILISLEGIIGTTHNFGLNGYLTKEHAQRLNDTFPEANIIIFIRRQHDIIASSYSQYICGGGTYSINRYLNHKGFNGLNGLQLFSYEFFNYYALLNLYIKIFGNNNVKVFIFEDLKENPLAFAKYFTESLKLKVNLDKVEDKPELPRLRLGIKILMRIANLFTVSNVLNKYYIINIPYWEKIYRPIFFRLNRFKIFGPRIKTKKILGLKNYNHISSYYKESNNKLIKDFGLKQIIKYNYPL